MSETKIVHFSTTGEYMKNLMLDLFSSGEFHAFSEILTDSKMHEEAIKKCWLHQFKMSGDTREDDGIQIDFLNESPKNYDETLYYAISTCLKSMSLDYDVYDLHKIYKNRAENKNLVALFNIFHVDEIFEICNVKILESEGFEITTLFEAVAFDNQTVSGILLQDGRFVQCGYQQHNELVPVLSTLKFIKVDLGSMSRFDHTGLEISSNMVSGNAAFTLKHPSNGRLLNYPEITDTQIAELLKAKEFITKFYSNDFGSNNVQLSLVNYYSAKIGHGKKYGNLEFLKTFYPEIQLPKYYKELPKNYWHNDDNERIFIRTSPEQSIPGILHSHIATNDTIEDTIAKIHEDYENSQNIKKNENYNVFFQELIEGANGVSMHRALSKKNLEYVYDYALSEKQGDIVNGKSSNHKLSLKNYEQLEKIGKKLSKDFRCKVQLEFVIDENDELYIVQFRTFDQKTLKVERNSEEVKTAIISGKTFTSAPWEKWNRIQINFDDILIVDEDADSNDLIGKEALIVKNNMQFSHILALSNALEIPSIYATNDFDSTKYAGKQVLFDTNNEHGLITLID